MDTIERIINLVSDESFQKYVAGTDSASTIYWTNWLQLHPENQADFQKAKEIVQILQTNTVKHEYSGKQDELLKILKKIKSNPQENKPLVQHLGRNVWLRVAAVFILAFSLGGFLSWQFFYKEEVKQQWFTTTVGKGEKSQLELPDGTKIWLNSDSKLKYAVSYGDTSREVYLEGEAYFDVAKNPEKQFVVHTNNLKVRVFGTKFNIKSYANAQKVETTLVEGPLSIQQVKNGIGIDKPLLLKPKDKVTVYLQTIENQINTPNPVTKQDKIEKSDTNSHLATINQHDSVSQQKNIDVQQIIGWKDKNLIFKNESFEEMAVEFERWYDVKIKFEDEAIKKFHFRVIFKNETLEQALQAMRFTTPFEYQIEKRNVYISKNKN